MQSKLCLTPLDQIGSWRSLILINCQLPILHDLPGVGKNLQDHCDVFLEEVVSSVYSRPVLFMIDGEQVAIARQQWNKDHTCPLDTHFCSNVVAYPKFPVPLSSKAFKIIDEVTRNYMLDPRVPSYESFMVGSLPNDVVF